MEVNDSIVSLPVGLFNKECFCVLGGTGLLRHCTPSARTLVHTMHGLIVNGAGVLSPRIVYFASPRTWLQLQTALDAEAKSHNTWTGM